MWVLICHIEYVAASQCDLSRLAGLLNKAAAEQDHQQSRWVLPLIWKLFLMHFKNVYRSYLLNYPALFPVVCVLVIQWNLAADFFPFAKSCIPVCLWCSHSGWQSCQSGPSFIWLALFYSVWLPLNAHADKNVFAAFKSADFDWSVFNAVVNELFEIRAIKKKKWCSTGAKHSLRKKAKLLFDLSVF